MNCRNALHAALALLLALTPGAAAGALPGPYLIFFDWEDDSLHPQAQAILANALAARRALANVRLVVEGHADRSHSDAASMDISRRRAWQVHDYFVVAGIPPETIIVHYYGEEAPLVETGDGIREPQNRRVEIRIETIVPP